MNITFVLPSGNTYVFKVNPSEYFQDYAKVIADLEHVRIESIVFTYSKSNIISKRIQTFTDHNIEDNDIINVVERSDVFEYEININIITGEILCIGVNSEDTVQIVKGIIETSYGYSADICKLIFAGKELENHRYLYSYSITRESMLHIVI